MTMMSMMMMSCRKCSEDALHRMWNGFSVCWKSDSGHMCGRVFERCIFLQCIQRCAPVDMTACMCIPLEVCLQLPDRPLPAPANHFRTSGALSAARSNSTVSFNCLVQPSCSPTRTSGFAACTSSANN